MYCSTEDTSLRDFYIMTLLLGALRQSTKIKIHWKIIIRQEKENFLSSRETRNWKRFSGPNMVFYQRNSWFGKTEYFEDKMGHNLSCWLGCQVQSQWFCLKYLAKFNRKSKVTYTKYSKYWPYTVAHTIDSVCRKC